MNKQDWKVKEFSEVFNLQMGKTPSRDNSLYWENGLHKWVSISDLGSGKYIYSTKERISELGRVESKIKVVPQNTVIMSFKLSIGKVAITSEDMYTNEAIMAFHPRNPDNLETEYIYYYLKGYKWGGSNRAVMGTTLNKASISSSQIIIPSRSIQKQIVKELDTLSEIIDNKKKQLAELDTLVQATFYEMFGDPVKNEKRWKSKKIKDFSHIKIGPFGSALHAEDYVENGIPLVNPSHMNNGQIIHSLNKTISEKKSKELVAYLLKKDDVVIGRRGEIGRCAIVTEKEEGFICGTGSIFLRFFDYMDPLYFYFVFTSKPIVKNLLNEAKGATMLNLNSKIIGNVNIIVPPLSLQTQFAERVKAIEQQKALIEQSIADVQQLFDSAMDKYFH
jgi:type I restriction enzyme S subunit